MLIAHEAPIDIMHEVQYSTDYCYALVHLFETHPEYYSYFKSSLLQGREVLLDNSIFELKEAFDAEKYAMYIRELTPTYYIVPDVLEDSKGTINSYKNFVSTYSDLPGIKIGAVQGKTYQDIAECYKFMSENADYIAISFDFSWYQTIGYSASNNETYAKLERMCDGRKKLISYLIADGIWNCEKPHHLLGNSLPKEMKAYKNIPNIRSVDTSNPVMAGLTGKRYIKGIGLYEKPQGLLADNIDRLVTDEEHDIISYNIHEFRRLCH
jgi:hypothetical protein